MHTRDRGQPARNFLQAWQAGTEHRFTEMKNCLEGENLHFGMFAKKVDLYLGD